MLEDGDVQWIPLHDKYRHQGVQNKLDIGPVLLLFGK